MRYRVSVVKVGYANIEAETEKQAEEISLRMSDSQFDWSKHDGAEVVEVIENE